MGIIIVILNVICCILYTIQAATSDNPFLPAVCAACWGVCAVLNTYTYIIRK